MYLPKGWKRKKKGHLEGLNHEEEQCAFLWETWIQEKVKGTTPESCKGLQERVFLSGRLWDWCQKDWPSFPTLLHTLHIDSEVQYLSAPSIYNLQLHPAHTFIITCNSLQHSVWAFVTGMLCLCNKDSQTSYRVHTFGEKGNRRNISRALICQRFMMLELLKW